MIQIQLRLLQGRGVLLHLRFGCLQLRLRYLLLRLRRRHRGLRRDYSRILRI